jgi:4-amino-4-deoxy-L-arabinose transferase-like glycosyltransferase
MLSMAFFPQHEVYASKGKPLHSSLDRSLSILAFLVSAWAVFGYLGGFPLLSPDEGRNAEVAREMSEAGAWLVPTYDGATYLDKPAFFFKAVALSFALFGESETTARLPSALFGFGLLAALFAFCRWVYGERTAALSMAIVATTPLYMTFSKIVIFDMTLAFFVCGAIFAAYLAEEYADRRRTFWYLAAVLSGGVATLVKGPVGFIVPLLVMAIFQWIEGRTDAIKRLFTPVHWGVFLAVVLPWFVGLSLACPDFPYYGIMKESIARFTTPEFRRTQPFYFYGLVIASCFFAWSLLLPESIAAVWRARRRLARADRLFIVWALVVVVFFSLSKSKLPGYILTGMVALGVLTARVFAAALDDAHGAAARIVRRGSLALLSIATPAALLMAAIARKPELLEQRFRFKPELFERFAPSFPAMALSLGGVALLAAVAFRLRDSRWAFAAFLSAPLLILTAHFDLLPHYADARSSRRLVERLPASLPENTEFACLKCLPHGLPFYLKRLVTVISDDGRELTSNYVLFSLASGKPRPERIMPFARMERWLASRDRPVFLIAKHEKRAVLEAIAAAYGVPVNDLGAGYWAALLPARSTR